MDYRNRNYERYGGQREPNDRDDRRTGDRDRGYGDDYRGYSRGYNLSREPNYRTERDTGYTGYGARNDEFYGREYSDYGRGGRSESYSERGFYGQGPLRSHLRCRDIMTRNVTTVHRDTPITEVARLMRNEDIGAVPVIGGGGKLEGIVTDRDLVVGGLTSEKADAELRAEDCMSTDLFTANQNERLVDVIREMGDHQVRRVPVVDGRERLVGIIAMADIATQTNKDMELSETLEEISQPPSWLSRLGNLFNW
jgi:CBS domain-containing protein